MADLKHLLAQKEALEKQIEETKRQQRQQAIEQIRELMAQYGLSAADLQLSKVAPRSARKPAAPAKKVAAKYRDPQTGESWSGRGLQPRWLKAALQAGRSLDEFRL